MMTQDDERMGRENRIPREEEKADLSTTSIDVFAERGNV